MSIPVTHPIPIPVCIPVPQSDGKGGSNAGSIAAGLLVPCFLFSACFAAAAVAIGKRNGGGAREGFNILVRGARDLPRSLPSVQVPSFSGGGYSPNTYFAGSGNDYASGNGLDAIPEATIVDAATGQPVQPLIAPTFIAPAQ
jgi:hypothetical protein